jgi:hypothetical protein
MKAYVLDKAGVRKSCNCVTSLRPIRAQTN